MKKDKRGTATEDGRAFFSPLQKLVLVLVVLGLCASLVRWLVQGWCWCCTVFFRRTRLSDTPLHSLNRVARGFARRGQGKISTRIDQGGVHVLCVDSVCGQSSPSFFPRRSILVLGALAGRTACAWDERWTDETAHTRGG